MTQCPTCKLSMDSHSTGELMECCMKQVDNPIESEANIDETKNTCPNCKHKISRHTNQELAECTIAYLKSGIRE
ncbi:MAG TPA: hypothetical protein VMW74_01415 [Nitrosopumilaceae archaeon]|nr:hypothetical protein [Nitrosopumilaceae archaeon]